MTTPFPFVAGQVLTAAQLNDIQNLPISDKTASYTLLATDVFKRTIMNAAGATTITVDDAIFTVGDVIQVANKGAGTCTITAGAGVTINTSGSLALAQYGGGYLLCLSASTFTFFNLGGGVGYGTATGGSSSSITVGGVDYTLLTFTSSGTLTITKAGFFDYLFIGGGAGCAFYNGAGNAGGGGGAGQVTTGSIYLSTNSTVTIGAGSAFGSFSAGKRSATDTTATVGTGYQTIYALGAVNESVNSGAGDAWQVCTTSGALAAASNTRGINNVLYGFQGGNSAGSGSGGGGGGFVSAGLQGVNASTGGVGGGGYDVSVFIGSSPLYKATGGGGGGTGAGGAGGNSSANSNAGSTNTTPGSASANSGSGGGAGVSTVTTGNGGSGIAYFRFR